LIPFFQVVVFEDGLRAEEQIAWTLGVDQTIRDRRSRRAQRSLLACQPEIVAHLTVANNLTSLSVFWQGVGGELMVNSCSLLE
jgi:hypothetical protein